MQIKSVQEDGSVVFRNGSVVLADVILHCTGYTCFGLFWTSCYVVVFHIDCQVMESATKLKSLFFFPYFKVQISFPFP